MKEIESKGAPNKSTVGAIGDIYTDTISGNKYVLEFIIHVRSYRKAEEQYIWKPVVASTSEGDAKTLIDVETGTAYILEVVNGRMTMREA